MKIIPVVVIIIVLCSTALQAAQNPFRSRGDDGGAVTQTVESKNVSACWSWIQPMMRWTNDIQKEIKERMTGFARDMKTNPFGTSFWLFLLMSFAYGVVHALGPGHGKSIAVSYFLGTPGHVAYGLLMGNLIAFVHVLSGVLVILFLYFILKVTGMADFDAASPAIEKISYSLIIAIGVYLAWNTIRQIKSGKFSLEANDSRSVDLKGLIATSAVTGLVPCPGAAIVLSFSIILGIMWQGLIAMVMIALGMGLTSSSFAIAAILARKAVLKLSSGSERTFIMAYTILSMLGAVTIITLGIVLLMGSR